MRSKIWLLLFLGILVSACGGNVRLTQQEVSPVYKAGEFAYAGAGRDLKVEVIGNPFGGDPAPFGKTVTDYMQGNHWGPRTNFTTTPGASARESYRVVMLFNPPRTLVGMRLCREEASSLPSESSREEIVVFAAFCRRNESLTEIKGRIDGATGPGDPIFGDLVAQTTNALFPPKRRFEGDRGGCPPWLQCE